LPAESKEGDILDIFIAIEMQETEAAKERVSSVFEKLKKRIEPIGMIGLVASKPAQGLR
jgi:hypothetical protein